MNAKQIIFDDDVRKKLLSGITILTKVVKTTLGPKGQNVIIDRPYITPIITKDGVSVAKEINVEDKFENMGIKLIKQVANNTAEEAGDGTTTATVLAHAIYSKGLKHILAGANPYALKRGINKAVQAVINYIKTKAMSIPAEDDTKIKQVATISANNDELIGEVIASAVKAVGKDGVITVETGKGLDIEVDVVEGLQINKGYMSPYFINNKEKAIVEYEDAYILFSLDKIINSQQILSLLNSIIKSGRPLVIIAEMETEPLNTLVLNVLKGKIKACVVPPPAFGDKRIEEMEDLAIITGGTVINSSMGLSINQVNISHLGQAKKIKIDRLTTTIIEGAGDSEKIQERIDLLRKSLSDSDIHDPIKKEKQQRLAKLLGGVAVIRVGGATETEINEIKDRIDDALHATIAAIEEGIVAGGGVMYIRALFELERLKQNIQNEDEKLGILIVEEAIQEPIKAIMSNAGLSADVIINKIKSQDEIFDDIFYGYNVLTDKWGNLIDMGVIDPVKVIRVALTNATSISTLLLSSNAMVTDIEQDKMSVQDLYKLLS